MQLWRHPALCRFAARLMLGATLAFVHQGAMTAVSQAAAATGLMPDPAVTLSGDVHYHSELARHVHAHHGDQVGHIHGPLEPDSDDASRWPGPPVCSLGIASCVLPVAAAWPLLFENGACIALRVFEPLTGIDPEPLSRPPSTPSIA